MAKQPTTPYSNEYVDAVKGNARRARAKLNGAIAHTPETVHSTDESTTGERIYARYQQAQADMLEVFGAPGWKRTLVAFATTLVVGYGIGYLAGTVLTWMVAGAILMGASAFVTIAAWALGAIAAVVYGGKFAARIGGAILTGEADERAIAAYDATRAFAAKLNPMRLFESKNTATVH